MTKKKRNIAIIMDEIDMNNGDKGGLNSLIKLTEKDKNRKVNDQL